MSSWRKCKLGEIIDVKHGYAFKGENITTDKTSDILVTPGNFNIGGGFKSSKFKYFNGSYPEDYIFNEGDIVVTMTDLSKEGDTLGYSAKIPKCEDCKYLHNQRVGLVKFISNDVYKDFIYWLMRTREYQSFIVGAATGTSIRHTSPKLIKEYEFEIPSLEEQKAIAEVLSSLDDKIDLLHRQNKTLESIAQTLFRQWFIEEAKEEWEVGTLGEVIEIFDNKRIPLSKMQRDKMKDGELYPYYGAAQIMDYVNDFIFDGEYILMGEDGTVRTDEGYPILQYATGKFWVNNHTHVLQAKEPYSNFFIWNYLAKKNIDKIVTGAVQPKINQGNLKSLDFPKFPLDLVQAFNEQSQAFFEKINQNKQQIQTLENLRDTLLPKLLSGEVRVDV